MKITLVLLLVASGYAVAATSPANQTPPTNSAPPRKMVQVSLTPSELQELRAARYAALQKNPSLQTDGIKMMARMRAFEEELDAAVVKSDPSLSAAVAKMEAERPRATMPPATQPHPTPGK